MNILNSVVESDTQTLTGCLHKKSGKLTFFAELRNVYHKLCRETGAPVCLTCLFLKDFVALASHKLAGGALC